ncbi:alpha/beta hydrolase [Psychroserpens sp.]|jgi:predicted alpha/beta superfamily hydrolase|uniref:alpha/beta hydrolase n=1 Tax=Psychroserpens sp. TaxID=2020870 RepID=UPI0039E4797D
MKQLVIPFFYILVFSFQPLLSQSKTDSIIENKFTIYSTILKENRTCLIDLPDTYNDPNHADKKYPILILLDGYTFLKTTAGIVHFMSSDRNRNYFMPETIIVAIENVDRERDFTVNKLKTKRVNTMGGGENFLNFIEKELISYVDKNYRTEPYRTLVGHSLGGLLTINSYMNKSSIFDAYISIDPSIWWDEELMENKVDAINSISFKRKIYIATANQVNRRFEKNKKRHDRIYELMKIKSNEKANIKVKSYDNESHRSVPLIALYEGLKYLNQDN